MYQNQIKKINEQLKTTDKAIIALGCSFVQGQGAVNDELYTEYKWTYPGLGAALEPQIDSSERTSILEKYPNVANGPDNKLDFTFMEYDNAFVNVLCKKYFSGKYVPINLGLRGCGNRATIKELYFHPEINWSKIKEIIVIYCPSGLERFDFINDQWSDHFHWKCMWPHYENVDGESRKKLWEGYNKTLWSDKQGALEQIAHVQELMLWCKAHNAKLIITPGFDRRYSKKEFERMIKSDINREVHTEQISNVRTPLLLSDEKKNLIDMFPWDNMFSPQGHSTFVDLVMGQETGIDKNNYFFQFLGSGSPNMWITPCAHPSAKAHDLFAKELFNHINKNL
jgi:hypothetical protein